MIDFILIVAWGLIIWFFICNQRTFRERGKLIDAASAESERRIDAEDYDNFLEPFVTLRRVTYTQHLWYRLTFRNPMLLYDS